MGKFLIYVVHAGGRGFESPSAPPVSSITCASLAGPRQGIFYCFSNVPALGWVPRPRRDSHLPSDESVLATQGEWVAGQPRLHPPE